MDGLLTDHDYAQMLTGDMDLEAQLRAIREVLARNREAEEALTQKIDELTASAKEAADERSRWLDGHSADQNHHSVFQDAAHSAAAVGMIAPLIETIMVRLFSGIGEQSWPLPAGKRNDRARGDYRFWDPQTYFGDEVIKTNIVAGALQLYAETGLKTHLPSDTIKILEALFEYRNEMLHNGFEWPRDRRDRFWQRAQTAWPPEWFLSATWDGRIWVIYMSDVLILRCLSWYEEMMAVAGAFARRMSEDHGWNDRAPLP